MKKIKLDIKFVKDVAKEEKPRIGKLANEVKESLGEAINKVADKFDDAPSNSAIVNNLTLPDMKKASGSLHPNTLMQYELEQIFTAMGFRVLEGPDIESEYFNFTALNIPADHPARDIQDTFWLDDGNLLKTHT